MITQAGKLTVYDRDDASFLVAHKIGSLYFITTVNGETIQSLTEKFTSSKSVSKVTYNIWHARLGHAHDKALKKIEIVHEAFEDYYSNKDCETCIRGKMKRKPFPEGGQHPTTRPLERIHSDVSQIDPPSRGGNRYFVMFQDNFSNFGCAKPIKNKSEVAETFQNFIVKSEVALDLKVKEIQTDNGGIWRAISRNF